ncbi:hypothetical protein ACLFKT_19815, partial [Paraburkholderia sp. BR14261]
DAAAQAQAQHALAAVPTSAPAAQQAPVNVALAPAASLSPGETVNAPPTTTNTPIAKAADPGGPVAAGGMGAPPPQMTETQARALAEKKVPAVMDFFNKQGVPRIAQAYLAQGNAEKAQAWTDWAAKNESQKHLQTWAKMWRASQTGDVEAMGDHAMDLYNEYEDGSTATSKEVVKDKDGNVTGFNVKLKNDETGEERSTFIGKDQMLNMGLSALSPPQMFEAAYKAQQTKDAAAAKAAEKVGEARLKLAGDLAVENARQSGRTALQTQKASDNIARDNNNAKNEAANRQNKVADELSAKVGALRAAGYSDQQIRDALPRMLGANEFKRGFSPEETRRQLTIEMSKDALFNAQPAEKKRKAIDDAMNTIYGNGASDIGGSTSQGATGTTVNPFNGGDNPAKKGLPYLDTKTNKVVYR